MSEPLKNHFTDQVPRAIAQQIVGVWPGFPAKAFLADALALALLREWAADPNVQGAP